MTSSYLGVSTCQLSPLIIIPTGMRGRCLLKARHAVTYLATYCTEVVTDIVSDEKYPRGSDCLLDQHAVMSFKVQEILGIGSR